LGVFEDASFAEPWAAPVASAASALAFLHLGSLGSLRGLQEALRAFQNRSMALALVAGFGGFPPRIAARLASVCSAPATTARRAFFAAVDIL
jgi:hypothetical protein